MNQPKHYIDREVRKPSKLDEFFTEYFNCPARRERVNNLVKGFKEYMVIINRTRNIQEIGYKVFPLEGDE